MQIAAGNAQLDLADLEAGDESADTILIKVLVGQLRWAFLATLYAVGCPSLSTSTKPNKK
jgi:hypothetical protein